MNPRNNIRVINEPSPVPSPTHRSYVPHLPRMSETMRGHSFESGFGGKGANQCVAAHKLGSRTSMVAKLGKDPWGENYRDYLQKLRIDTGSLMLVDGLVSVTS